MNNTRLQSSRGGPNTLHAQFVSRATAPQTPRSPWNAAREKRRRPPISAPTAKPTSPRGIAKGLTFTLRRVAMISGPDRTRTDRVIAFAAGAGGHGLHV